MPDPMTVIIALGAASGLGAAVAGRMVLKHHAEMVVQGQRDPLAEALRDAFPLDPNTPADFGRMLERIDKRDA